MAIKQLKNTGYWNLRILKIPFTHAVNGWGFWMIAVISSRLLDRCCQFLEASGCCCYQQHNRGGQNCCINQAGRHGK